MDLRYLEVDIRSRTVETNSYCLKLAFEQTTLSFSLCRIQHHKDKIGGSGNRNNLLPAAFTLCCPFNDAWKIKQLNLCAIVLPEVSDTTAIEIYSSHLNYAGDTRECGKFVGRGDTLSLGYFRQKRGLSNGRKSDQSDPSVTGLSDLEALRFRST